jgi:hypothetical protein
MINSLTGSSTLSNLNSLSTNSTLSINNLNATSTTIFNKTNFSSLSVVGDINTSGLSVFNTLSGKQNNLTFSNPLLNTSNSISLKYDNTKLNVDASGNLTVVSGGPSQWTTTGTSIFYTTNNTVNTTNPVLRVTSNSIDCVATDGTTRLPLSFGGGALTFNSNGRPVLNKMLLTNAFPADTKASIESLLFNEGGIISSVFGGDSILTGYWGVAVNLNYGGWANGSGGGNNTQSYVPGWSAFTVNMRSSTSQTTFDRRLFTIMPDGNVSCTGTLTASGKINADNGILFINAADGTTGGTKGIIFRSGYETPNNNNHNCSILTYDHDANGFCDGLSINGFDGISFCTGSNTRLERMRITKEGNVACGGSISCNRISLSDACIVSGNVGIKNANPWVDLNLGNVAVGGSSGELVFAKNNAGGGIRQFKQGISSNFFFCLGDCGNVNNSSAPWTLQMALSYQAPASSFTITSSGQLIVTGGYATSDERIKTNIKTIENALEKTLLLRGVEYNNFKIDPDKKCLGLVAQEVELIIPEVVSVNEMDNIKCISYNSLIGVLIEAIKELNNKVFKLENILKNNNLN